MVSRTIMGNRTFGRWAVLSDTGSMWLCRCECGTERAVNKYNLLRGKSTSCGCDRDRIIAAARRANTKHGMDGTPTYRAWVEMRRRCRAANRAGSHLYIGRGVRVHPEWETSFETFLLHVGERPSPKHSLDRYPDNCGDYAPGNVRWATPKEQANNKRTNHMVEVGGVTMTIAQAAEATGLPRDRFRDRRRPHHDDALMRVKA